MGSLGLGGGRGSAADGAGLSGAGVGLLARDQVHLNGSREWVTQRRVTRRRVTRRRHAKASRKGVTERRHAKVSREGITRRVEGSRGRRAALRNTVILKVAPESSANGAADTIGVFLLRRARGLYGGYLGFHYPQTSTPFLRSASLPAVLCTRTL